MAHDGSIAAQVEDWMIGQIGEADEGNVLFGKIDHFDGVRSDAIRLIVEEILAKRDRVALVYCTGAVAEELSAGDQAVGTEYEVLIGAKNARGCAGRIGESAEKPGIHLLREVVQVALHNQHPGASNDRLATEVCRYQRYATVCEQATGWIAALTFVVPEVPVAA